MEASKERDSTSDCAVNQSSIAAPKPCSICSSQMVTWLGDSWSDQSFDQADDDFKRRLFHADCLDCASAQDMINTKLCIKCTHLQLRHLFVCSPATQSSGKEIMIRIDPFRVGNSDCEFCQYIAACLLNYWKYTGNDVDIMMDGTFSLGLPKALGNPFRIGPQSKYVYVRFSPRKTQAEGSQPHKKKVLVDPFVNWNLLRDWISTEDFDSPQDSDSPPYQRNELQNLRVIDITQLCICNHPLGQPFIALSYVWGWEPGGQFQTMRHNIADLEKPGSVTNVNLPRTILDAIEACRMLNSRYLWVDRLCIIQDDLPELKTIQLDQMGAVYRKATFTIVALAGEGATHGLPGVSKPRLSAQKTLSLSDIELVESTPSLQDCSRQSKWQTRGWTYQESESSLSMLYFTDFGVYYRSRRSDLPVDVEKREGPAQVSATLTKDECFLDRIGTYTKRSLTHPSDILRAFSGMLYEMYRQNTTYGMPLAAFDRAILWESFDYICEHRVSTPEHIFPTWSWTSALGPVHFRDAKPRGCSLALWGIVRENNTDSQATVILEPNDVDERMFYDVSYSFRTHVSAALAWKHGCIRSKAADDLTPNCSRFNYSTRLQERWPDYLTYWHEAFESYNPQRVFSKSNVELARVPGHIMVHTQTAWFMLDWLAEEGADSKSGKEGRNAFLIRGDDGLVAGGIYLGQHWARPFKIPLQRKLVQFILLSTTQYPGTALMAEILGEHARLLNLSELYGCPCSRISPGYLSEPKLPIPQHIPSCLRHPDFLTSPPCHPWPPRPPRRCRMNSDNQVKACAKHLADLSYFDPSGGLLHQWDDVPSLNVMMIGSDDAENTGIAFRIGIGQIYLRRWVEAAPRFETVVLR